MPGLEIIYRGFWELSSDRSIGMGLGPIPHTSIRAYVVEYDLEEEDEADFKYLIRKMDSFYLEWSEKKREDDSKLKKGAK